MGRWGEDWPSKLFYLIRPMCWARENCMCMASFHCQHHCAMQWSTNVRKTFCCGLAEEINSIVDLDRFLLSAQFRRSIAKIKLLPSCSRFKQLLRLINSIFTILFLCRSLNLTHCKGSITSFITSITNECYLHICTQMLSSPEKYCTSVYLVCKLHLYLVLQFKAWKLVAKVV